MNVTRDWIRVIVLLLLLFFLFRCSDLEFCECCDRLLCHFVVVILLIFFVVLEFLFAEKFFLYAKFYECVDVVEKEN